MSIEDIIETFNVFIDNKRKELNISNKGHLVILKTVTPHKTFKAYKTIEVSLWYVEGRSKKEVFSNNITDKILDSQLVNKPLERLYKEVINFIYTIIDNKEIDKLVKEGINGIEGK